MVWCESCSGWFPLKCIGMKESVNLLEGKEFVCTSLSPLLCCNWGRKLGGWQRNWRGSELKWREWTESIWGSQRLPIMGRYKVKSQETPSTPYPYHQQRTVYNIVCCHHEQFLEDSHPPCSWLHVAGTGKSYLISAIAHALDNVWLLTGTTGTTGMAAFNICGNFQ